MKALEVATTGATRRVILTKRFALKIPACGKWRTLLLGLLANMQEREFATTKWPELAPVVASDQFGCFLIMPRVRVMTRDEFARFDYHGFTHRADGSIVPAESKPDSFGWLNGRVVAIDYGN